MSTIRRFWIAVLALATCRRRRKTGLAAQPTMQVGRESHVGVVQFSEKAYRCSAVRTYSVLSSIAGVAPIRSPSGEFFATTSGELAPALTTVIVPSVKDAK